MKHPAEHRARRTRLIWGSLAAIVYIASARWTADGLWPVRILYDGFVPPPPYRWVRPPAAAAARNQRPEAGAGLITFAAEGSEYASVATGDGQAIAIFGPSALPPSAGESAVRVTLAPLDPATIHPSPAGLRIDGNAYRIDATYLQSQRPVALRKPVTIVLRYPSTGTQILRSTESAWTALRSTAFHMSLQTLADSDRLGIFAAAAPAGGPAAILGGQSKAAPLVLGTVLAVLVGFLLRCRARPREPPHRVARARQTTSPRPSNDGRGLDPGLAVAQPLGCGTMRI
jgi:hypothetical protein